jgi:predicted flap endonuclease-1-like 5' DNA nuclease
MFKKQYLKNKAICKVTFELPLEAAPHAKTVKLLGDFNDWDWSEGAMMEAGATAFTVTLELETGKSYQFRYLIDNHIWENDWEADNYVPTPFGVYNSVVVLEENKLEKPVKVAPAKKSSTKKQEAAANDDLTKIEGIGPKIAEILANNGIATFSALGKAKAKDIKATLEAAGSRYKMHDPTTWPDQAKMAAKGDWDKLAKWQEELKGGRKG